RLSTNGVSARVFNNVLLTTAEGSLLSIVDATGLVELANNVIRPGWQRCHGEFSGLIRTESNIETDERVPADVAAHDFRPSAGSPLIDRGRAPPESRLLDHQFLAPFGAESRLQIGSLDIGAFEFAP